MSLLVLDPSVALIIGHLPPSLGSHLPSSTSSVVLNQGYFCPPKGWTLANANVCVFLLFFWLSKLKWEKGDALNILQYGRQPLTIKNYPVQMLIVLRLRNPAVQSSLFSKHARLSHMLLCLNIACFLYLECPALLLRLRNDHLPFRI